MKKVKKHKISRRLQAPLFENCQTQKFALREQRRVPKRRRRSASEYGKQLAEKQKMRYLYSVSERVLKNYVKKAVANQKASAEEALAEVVERRLDNVVYQLNLVPTRRMARQLVSHGHFTINGRKTTVPSYQVRDTDTVGIREGSTKTKLFEVLLAGNTTKSRVGWASWDSKARQGTITGKPVIGETVFSIPSILEYYSR
ncbi:MAG: 30S ribosomal protein S4 [Candidatus Kaiserbacteria bacterium]|nr:30S ribosomal protein S4 [Candidatus Kaiserbacteria bacterium]